MLLIYIFSSVECWLIFLTVLLNFFYRMSLVFYQKKKKNASHFLSITRFVTQGFPEKQNQLKCLSPFLPLSLSLPVDMSIFTRNWFRKLYWPVPKAGLGSWRLRRVNVVPVGRSWDPGGADVAVQVWRQEKDKTEDLIAGGSAFLFCSGLSPVGMGPPTLVREIWIAQCTDSNVILTNTPRIMSD